MYLWICVTFLFRYHGHDDVIGWREAASGLRMLGGNGLRVYPSRSLGAVLRGSDGDDGRRCDGGGEGSSGRCDCHGGRGTTTKSDTVEVSSTTATVDQPFVALMGNTMAGFGPGMSGNEIWWGGTQEEVGARHCLSLGTWVFHLCHVQQYDCLSVSFLQYSRDTIELDA